MSRIDRILICVCAAALLLALGNLIVNVQRLAVSNERLNSTLEAMSERSDALKSVLKELSDKM